jgi:hypothetical protein
MMATMNRKSKKNLPYYPNCRKSAVNLRKSNKTSEQRINMRLVILALLGVLQTSPVAAEGFAWPSLDRVVGVSRLFTNDFIGDGNDRWRTGSYAVSVTFGDQVVDGLPSSPFEVMEYRLRAEIIAPEDLSVANPFPDRAYAGVVGLGAFTHYERDAYNISYGGELVFVGPRTGLDDFQQWAHDRLGVQGPTAAATQLGNKIYPTVQGEVSRDIRFGNGVFRPFVEAQVGIESYARVGFDTVFGQNVSQNFFVRDTVTGHLLTNSRHSDDRSFGFMVGGDVAYVGDS